MLRLKGGKQVDLCCKYEDGIVSYKKGFVPTSRFTRCNKGCGEEQINGSCWKCMGCVNSKVLTTQTLTTVPSTVTLNSSTTVSLATTTDEQCIITPMVSSKCNSFKIFTTFL